MATKHPYLKIVFLEGLALFAMFFGAGNIIFPLIVGLYCSHDVFISSIFFLLSGIGMPLIGLWGVHIHQGSYMKLFSCLGKVPKITILTFIVLFIGPLFGAPRTEIFAFESIKGFLPNSINTNVFISAVYFGLIFFMAKKRASIIHIIGAFVSPIKIIGFCSICLFGIWMRKGEFHSSYTLMFVIKKSFFTGYSTIDMFSAIFLGNIIYDNIKERASFLSIPDNKINKISILSSILGLGILSILYIFLIFVSHHNSVYLSRLNSGQLISGLAYITIGDLGAIFVSSLVFLACLSTAAGLVEVTVDFFRIQVFKNRYPRIFWLFMTILSMYLMSLLGFDKVMEILSPVLNILYPVTAIYILYSIISHKKQPV